MRYTTITLQSVTETTTGAAEFTFAPARPLPHAAGQAALVILPGAGGKPFTLSSDDRAGLLSIATSLGSGSRFKQALARLEPGDRAHLAGAIGAPVTRDDGLPLVAVAQGIGITPFLALARSRELHDTTLLQVGAPHYFDEVAAATTTAEHLSHRDELQQAIIRLAAARPEARWSISGRSDFTTAVSRQLAALGVTGRRIHKDAFWGMSAPHTTTPLPAAA